MSERPKRIIMRPSRYQTTSSDEAPKRRRMSNVSGNIDQDIGELRELFEEEDSMDNDFSVFNTSKTYAPNTHTQNIPPRTHVPSYLSPQNSFSQPRTQTYTYFPIFNNTLIDNVAHSSNTGIKFQEKNGMRSTSDIENSYQLPERKTESEEAYTERSVDESNNPILNERLDRFEAELKKINGLLQNILKCMQHLKSDRRRAPTKPGILPISSLEEMDIFEDIDDDGYSEIVNYFEYIGGFTLKEAVNLCLKEALTDSLTPSFTWWGREGDSRPLYNTRIIMAIYDAVCSNRYINNPTRSEFQKQMREALRTAKERCRSRMRGPRSTRPANSRPRDFWSDEQQEEENRRN